jgi:hypothetical protein
MPIIRPELAAASPAPLPIQGYRQPEHGLRGWILIGCFYLAAPGCGLAMMASLHHTGAGRADTFLWLLISVFVACIPAWIGYAVQRFECWVWFFLNGFLAVLAFAVWIESDRRSSSGMAFLIVAAGTAHYLWERRADFWVDTRRLARALEGGAAMRRWRLDRIDQMDW